jgi:uncharacterized protein (TIGR02147 family)
MMASMEQPSIYNYLDYRGFLQDLFEFRKQGDRGFSHRSFAQRAGFASPNFLKLVMAGRRNLTTESLAKVARGFGLKKQEREYLENLVYMNQAATHDEKNHYYAKLMRLRSNSPVKLIDKACYEYLSTWYCPAVREIITFGGGHLSAPEIASLLTPGVTAREVERALAVLLDLGLIRRTEDGAWQQCDKALTTGPEVQMLGAANFHREMIRLAGEAIERFPAAERDIGALTLSIPAERFAEIKKRIVAFRRELLALACEDDRPDRVVQVNIQLFPLTRPYEKENGQ